MQCQKCHNSKSATAGLNLESPGGFRKGAKIGPIVRAGDADKSRLIQVISYQERIKMPPTGKLRDDEIAALREWVKMGAPWPTNPEQSVTVAQRQKQAYTKAQKEFWSFRPLQKVTPPDIKNAAWVRTPIDRFILSRLETTKMQPASPADKLVLIRRATLDLTGLPPKAEEIQAFLSDESLTSL